MVYLITCKASENTNWFLDCYGDWHRVKSNYTELDLKHFTFLTEADADECIEGFFDDLEDSLPEDELEDVAVYTQEGDKSYRLDLDTVTIVEISHSNTTVH